MNLNKLKKMKDLYYLNEFQHIKKHDFFSNRVLIHSPLYLPDILKSFKFLNHIINKESRIFIFGDKDVDGITSTVILYDYLHHKYPRLEIYLDNSSEGDFYGISGKIINKIKEINPHLIFFLDMGSSHIHLIKNLLNTNKYIIIIDHHIPQLDTINLNEITNLALINPLYSSIELEHKNKISTSGLTLKFIIGFEFYLQNIIHKIQIIKNNKFFYGYQNGYFLNKASNILEIKDINNTKPIKYSILDYNELKKYFSELNYELFTYLIETEPIEIGKYITALSIELRNSILELFRKYSTIASIGLIADQVPLIGENRTIVKAGLGLLKHKPIFIEGLKALFQKLGLNSEALTSKDIGWTISPVINAAGRMGETQRAIELLLEKNPIFALEKADYLLELNNKRKDKTKKNLEILERNKNCLQEENSFVFFYSDDLEPGVSGIMASRLAEKYQKPAIWINPEGEFAKGSVRSWGGVNVLKMLLPLKDIFVDIGGHAEAVGFTIEYEKIEILKEQLKNIVNHYHEGLNNSLIENNKNYIEFSIHPEMLGEDLLHDLRLLEPFGPENPEIYFLLKQVKICEVKIFNEKHLKFKVVRSLSDIEFILWNAENYLKEFINVSNLDIVLDSLKEFRWNISGIFETNIYYPTYTNCKYRFFVKFINKVENIDEKLKFLNSIN